MLVALFAVVTLTALIAVLLPLLRGGQSIAARGNFDRAVYRDQLEELDRDVARGLINETEAAGARLEIQRRLLAADDAGAGVPVRSSRSPALAAVLALVVTGGATALYLARGAPAVPDAPYADRVPPGRAAVAGDDQQGMRNAAAALAAKLAQNPDDAQGWLLYARVEGMLSDWAAAADAFRHAMARGRVEPDVQAGYGEMLVMQARGTITPAAQEAFAAALKSEPGNEVARYYTALAAGQAGETQKAIDGLQALAADLPSDNPMRAEIDKRIQEVAKQGGVPVPKLADGKPPAAPGPDAQAMAAAAQMPEGDRKAMIAAMVEKLAARLAATPSDLHGWLRLGRAYTVMDERAKAIDAYEHAAALQPNDPQIKLLIAQMLLTGLSPSDPFPPRAVALLREVQLLTPDEPAVLWYLGVEAVHTGHREDARRYWTQLLAKLPAGGDAEMVKAALAQVEGS